PGGVHSRARTDDGLGLLSGRSDSAGDLLCDSPRGNLLARAVHASSPPLLLLHDQHRFPPRRLSPACRIPTGRLASLSMLALLLHDVYEREPAESGFPGALAGRYKVTLRELEFVLRALDAAWHTPPLLAGDASICQHHGFALTVDDGGVSYYT